MIYEPPTMVMVAKWLLNKQQSYENLGDGDALKAGKYIISGYMTLKPTDIYVNL